MYMVWGSGLERHAPVQPHALDPCRLSRIYNGMYALNTIYAHTVKIYTRIWCGAHGGNVMRTSSFTHVIPAVCTVYLSRIYDG